MCLETEQAKDAVMIAQIPTTVQVNATDGGKTSAYHLFRRTGI
jgi:hypothetical protein